MTLKIFVFEKFLLFYYFRELKEDLRVAVWTVLRNNHGTLHRVANTFRYKNDVGPTNDIALILIKGFIHFNDYVHSVPLAPTNYKLNHRDQVLIAGWGCISVTIFLFIIEKYIKQKIQLSIDFFFCFFCFSWSKFTIEIINSFKIL